MTQKSKFAIDVEQGSRFRFGENWSKFLKLISDQRIQEAENSLKEYLEVDNLENKTFLDIGSGSGLFSLAARRLGAKTRSFDFDPDSVACTQELKRCYYPNDRNWEINLGSVLDRDFLCTLGSYDIVYAWGVLHHTGRMWEAIDNAAAVVKPSGLFYIAIYNHQKYWSSFHTRLKRLYNRWSKFGKIILASVFIVSQVAIGIVRDLLFLTNPRKRYRDKIKQRGMSKFHDWIDWIGGYPFEVAKPEEVFDFLRARGFSLLKLRTMGDGPGCNEFVLLKKSIY